jgi:hypothetical protein
MSRSMARHVQIADLTRLTASFRKAEGRSQYTAPVQHPTAPPEAPSLRTARQRLFECRHERSCEGMRGRFFEVGPGQLSQPPRARRACHGCVHLILLGHQRLLLAHICTMADFALLENGPKTTTNITPTHMQKPPSHLRPHPIPTASSPRAKPSTASKT